MRFDPENSAMIRYGKVEGPYWNDRPVMIVASGASLTGFDLNRLKGLGYILAVKSSIFDIPFADAGFGIDAPRYMEWASRLAEVRFPIYWGASGVHKLEQIPNVIFLKRSDEDKPSLDPEWVTCGGTSGWAAVNLALHKDARQIILFGFDYGAQGDSNFHYNEHHYLRKRSQAGGKWIQWAKRFDFLLPEIKKRGITVLNASPISNLNQFQKITVEEAVIILAEQKLKAA